MVEHNISPFMNVTAGSALDPGLRVKWGGTAGQVVIADDEACIGVVYTRAYAQGDKIVIIDIRAPGYLPFVAGGAIAAGAAFSSAENGKVVTGTDGEEAYGVAKTATTGDGGQFMGTSAK